MRMKTGVFIDDTGTPSQKSKSKYDSGDWKTWVAMFVKPTQRIRLEGILNELLATLKTDLKVSEFHFTHIFSGKGNFRKLSQEQRIGIFHLFGEIYKEFRFPIIVQSLTSDDVIRNKMGILPYLKVDNFDFSKNSDLALWFLIEKSCTYIKENNLPLLAEFYVDSGRQKPNTNQKISLLNGITENSELTYCSSEDNVMIQFIDFIAFSVNRMRWIMMNEKKSDLDKIMLTVISEFKLNVVNLEMAMVDIDNFTAEDYDKTLRKVYDKNGNLKDEIVDKIKKNKR